MNSGLSKYLAAVAHELRGLPKEKRELELREMRQHLEAIVARLVEGGASEEEAVEAAIAQFGAARRVGRELHRASSEGEVWWRAVLAPAFAFLCDGFTSVVGALILARLDLGQGWLLASLTTVLVYTGRFASGFIAGRISPRRAGWGLTALYCTISLLSWQLMEQGSRGGIVVAAWYQSRLWLALPIVCLGALVGSRLSWRHQMKIKTA